ncbi:MAG: hypothetical protein K2J87_01850, partial [Muribaculaceae bacterium]|nr:hypothetical protein [Muribaculaceae bacterium]
PPPTPSYEIQHRRLRSDLCIRFSYSRRRNDRRIGGVGIMGEIGGVGIIGGFGILGGMDEMGFIVLV